MKALTELGAPTQQHLTRVWWHADGVETHLYRYVALIPSDVSLCPDTVGYIAMAQCGEGNPIYLYTKEEFRELMQQAEAAAKAMGEGQ